MQVHPLRTLLTIKPGSGRKGDLVGTEDDIKKELNDKNYFLRKQIADMIWKKFKIRIKLSEIGEYLKNRALKSLSVVLFQPRLTMKNRPPSMRIAFIP